jgi:hypothetical protein
VPRVVLTETWQFWLTVIGAALGLIGAAGGVTGAVTGILAYRRSSRTDERSAKAAERSADEATKARVAGERGADAAEKANRAGERSADAAERSADAADRAVVSADRSANSAEVSAREAQAITRIEKDRYHAEIGPHVSVRFLWRPTLARGGIVAYVTNNGRHDIEAQFVRTTDRGMREDRGRHTLHVGETSEVLFADFPMPELGDMAGRADQWNEQARALAQRQQSVAHKLDEALRTRRDNLGFLLVEYRSPDACPCDRIPPSTEWDHWTTRHVPQVLEL